MINILQIRSFKVFIHYSTSW